MGDPRFHRKGYETPTHPWQGERIKKEIDVVRAYGLKNKREVWKAQTRLRRWRAQARAILPRLPRQEPQAQREAQQLLKSLHRVGILEDTATVDDVLALTIESILNRRLQTVVYRHGLAQTAKGARQFITHGHVLVEGRRCTIPGRLVTRDAEGTIEFFAASPLANELHPMRPKPQAVASGVAEPAGAAATAGEAEPAPEPAKESET